MLASVADHSLRHLSETRSLHACMSQIVDNVRNASRSNYPWSQAEDERLCVLIESRMSASRVAVSLQRTTRSIRRRAEVLRISWKAPRVDGRGDRTKRVTSGFVEGFGCRPTAAVRLVPGPASESRQGRNPREFVGGGAASAGLWNFVYDGSG